MSQALPRSWHVSERLYTATHEWVTVDDDVATVGITEFAQGQLGDVVYVELPPIGKLLEAGDSFGVIESVKAASDLYSPVAGSVIEVNSALTGAPEAINQDPYEQGWMVRVRLNGDVGADLLDEAGYRSMVEAEGSH
jgi:glycine cleavage system H protein